jgi:hypothetical protein
MEGQEALRALARRFPNLSLQTETQTYVPTLNTRTLQRLSVILG